MILSQIRSPLGSPFYAPTAKGGGATVTYPIDSVGGALPAYAYGVAKLRSAYTGPAMRVLRPSDSVEQDIGFVGQAFDLDALTLFLGSQSGQVMKFYDQTGQGNDTSIPALSGNRGVIVPSVTIGQHPIISFGGGNYPTPASLTWDRRSISAYAISENHRGYLSTFGTAIVNLTGGEIPQLSTIKLQSKPVIIESLFSAASRIDTIDTETAVSSALSAGTAAGGGVGAGGGNVLQRTAVAWIAYQRVLDTMERTTMKGALQRVFGLSPTAAPGRLIVNGDSIAFGTGAVGNFGWASRVQRSLSPQIACYNAAAGGKTIATKLTEYAAGIKTVLTSYSDNRVVFLHIGTNDITALRSAADIYADLQTYAGLVRGDGGKIILSTILPASTHDAGKQAVRATINSNLRANWASFADGLADFAADPTMSNPVFPQYSDGLHPSSMGHALLAPIAAAAINALL